MFRDDISSYGNNITLAFNICLYSRFERHKYSTMTVISKVEC